MSIPSLLYSDGTYRLCQTSWIHDSDIFIMIWPSNDARCLFQSIKHVVQYIFITLIRKRGRIHVDITQKNPEK